MPISTIRLRTVAAASSTVSFDARMPIRVLGASGADTARKALPPIWTVRGSSPRSARAPETGADAATTRPPRSATAISC